MDLDTILPSYQNAGSVENRLHHQQSVWAFVTGAALASLSGFLLGVSNCCAALCLENGMNAFQVLFVNSVGTVILTSLALLCSRINICEITRRDWFLTLGKGCVENLGRVGFNAASVLAGGAKASLITDTTFPACTMLVAFLGLKERCKISELVALLLDVAGVVLTCSSSILAVGTEASESNSALLTTLGCTFAAISGVIFYPCGAVLTRTIDSNLRVGVIMLLNGLLGIFITIPVVYLTAEEPVTQTLGETPSLYGYVSGACLFYVMYLWSYNRSLQLEKAGRVATLVTVVVVVNYFTQLLIFHYVAQWWEIVGVVLVLLSSFLITAVVWREKDEFFIPNGVLADCSCNIHCLD